MAGFATTSTDALLEVLVVPKAVGAREGKGLGDGELLMPSKTAAFRPTASCAKLP